VLRQPSRSAWLPTSCCLKWKTCRVTHRARECPTLHAPGTDHVLVPNPAAALIFAAMHTVLYHAVMLGMWQSQVALQLRGVLFFCLQAERHGPQRG
jgi:hypothetical protein